MGTFLWLFERRLAVAYSSAGPHAFDRTPKALNGKPATIDKIQRAADCFRCFFAPLLLRAHSDRESVRQFRSNPLGSVWSPGRLGPVPLWRCVSRLRLPVDMEPEDNASPAPAPLRGNRDFRESCSVAFPIPRATRKIRIMLPISM